MRFLIDTHCLLWMVSSPGRLRPQVVDLIENRDNSLLFSAVSGLEIAIKSLLGKLELPEPPGEFVRGRVEALSLTPLPIFLSHALRVAELPAHHRDPFDRILVAQSQIENLPLMTADPWLTKYEVEILWAARSRAPRRAGGYVSLR